MLEPIFGRPNFAVFEPLAGNLPLYLTMLAMSWIGAPFGEEVIYRGFIQTRLALAAGNNSVGWWLGIFVQAGIFAILHLYQGWTGVIEIFVFGVAVGWLYWRSGRSLVPLLAREPTSEAEPIEVFSYLDYEGRKGMSVIYGQWKLIEPLSSSFAPSRELYDRLEDPDEQIDLSAQYPILAGYLASLVRQQLLELEQLPEVESMEFDDQTRQQLKALGYFE